MIFFILFQSWQSFESGSVISCILNADLDPDPAPHLALFVSGFEEANKK
jgi:hypothetical protein